MKLIVKSILYGLYFTKTLWPDFTKENLLEALINFNKRERRFGKTSEQLID